ncbi:MAG: DUF1501 domain-containing protein [Gammaproteobacteria bacterium]|nr:DUF1501 domain-containing protein [Gammaproteobacteria bacterium]
MPIFNRRQFIRMAAIAPALPYVLGPRALGNTVSSAAADYDGPVVVMVRLRGGNDGLNTVVPLQDDHYHRARPNIALKRGDTLALSGGDFGLHRSLADFMQLMDRGDAGIVQAVGYPQSSRSHLRANEIWESALPEVEAPATGWLGRYLDSAPHGTEQAPVGGLEFGREAALTLKGAAGRNRLVERPERFANLQAEAMEARLGQGPANPAFEHLGAAERALADVARLAQRASRGAGARHAYPDTAFGRSLRWTADMIETHCSPRAYFVSVGSFDEGAASFDTHIDQLPQHRLLYGELGRGIRAFADHLREAGAFRRVVLLTFSDFGRMLPENRTRGTEHGDASVLLYAGGSVHAGIRGAAPNLGEATDGGVPHRVDFRSVYADVLDNWLAAPAANILSAGVAPFAIVRRPA